MRRPVRRFFDSVAVGWDGRVRSNAPEYLMPLQAALDRLQAKPARILDIGAGTGAAALELADRYRDAEVVGIDVSAQMVAQAGARAADLRSRVGFLVADVASFEDQKGFDLIAMLNMPPFFDRWWPSSGPEASSSTPPRTALGPRSSPHPGCWSAASSGEACARSAQSGSASGPTTSPPGASDAAAQPRACRVSAPSRARRLRPPARLRRHAACPATRRGQGPTEVVRPEQVRRVRSAARRAGPS